MRAPRGIPLLLTSSVLFGLMAVLVRAAMQAMPLGETLLVRFAIATVGAVAASRMFGAERGGRRDLLALRGVFGGIAVVLYYYALFRLPAATAALLNTSSPVFSIAFARVFLGEQPPRGVWPGIVVATVGTALVVAGSSNGDGQATAMGLIAGLLSAAFSGAAIPSIRAARRYYNAGTVFLAFSVFGILVSLPVSVGESWSTGLGLWLGIAAGIVSLAAQLTFTQALGQVDTWLAAALGQLTPLSAWMLGLAFLGEHLSPLASVGALLTAAGVGFASSREHAPIASAVR